MHTEIAIAGLWQGPPYFDEFKIKFWCRRNHHLWTYATMQLPREINLSFPVNLH